MRNSYLAALLLLLGMTGLAARADDWNKQFTVTGKPELVTTVDDGNIEVRTGPAGQIQARVETRGWRIGSDEVRVEPTQSGNHLDVVVRVPHEHFTFGSHWIHVTLVVPAESTLNLRTKDGNVIVSGVKGSQRISTGDGNLDLNDLDGSLVADTGDGNIRVQGRFDLLDVHTGDGNIDAEARSGSKMTAGWTAKTGDGNIIFRLPSNFSADLDAHTGDGRVRADFPITTNGALGENTMRGKMNGGGFLLQIQSGDGDLRIEKGSSASM